MTRDGSMVKKEINSAYLNETKELKIYHPRVFSTLHPYHICFMFDGNDYYRFGRITAISDEFHEKNRWKNTVFVGIHYKDKADRRRKYHPAGNEFENFTKFFINEAVPFVDELIPTHHKGISRLLMGESLAGTFALLTALRHPDLFGKVLLQSPFIDDVIYHHIEQASTHSKLDIYQTIGEFENQAVLSDSRIDDQLAPNRKLKELLLSRQANLTYFELENGEHTWKSWQKDMKRALGIILPSYQG